MAERYQRSTFYSPVGSDTGEARALQQSAQSFGSLSEMAANYGNRILAEDGSRRGQEEGYSLEAPKKKKGFTAGGRAYNQAAVQAHLARVDADILENTSRIAAESGEDPELFDSKLAGYAEGLLKNVDPSIRGRTEIAIGQQASALRQKIAAAQADTLRRNALSDVNQTMRVRADMMEAAFLDGDDERGEELMLGALEMVRGLERNADNPTGLLAYEDVRKQERAISDAATLASVVGIAKRKAATEGVYSAQQFVDEFKAKSNSELVEQGVSLELRQAMEAKLDALVEQERAASIEDAVNRIMTVYDRDAVMGQAALDSIRGMEIDDSDKSQILSKVNTRVNALQASNERRYVEDITRIEMQISSGVPPLDAERQVVDLYRKGALSQNGLTSMFKAIGAAREKAAAQSVEAAAAQAALERGERLDPKNKGNQKIVNSLFEQQASGAPVGSAPWRSKVTEIASQTGIIPDAAASWIRSSALSPDPDIASKGALLLDAISTTSPMVLDYMDEKTKSFHMQVSDMVKAGTAPVDAVAAVRASVYETTPQVRDLLKKSYTEEARSKTPRSRLQSLIGKDDDFDPSIFTFAPSAPIPMEADFDMLSQRYFTTNGGDIDQASRMAFRDLKSRWGRTTVNGRAEAMPYAPEMFGVPPDMVRAGLARQFGEERVGNLEIKADMKTGRILSDGSADLSYSVVEIVDGEVNVIGRFNLPGVEDIEQTIQDRRAKNIEASRRENEAKQRLAREMMTWDANSYIGSVEDLNQETLRRFAPVAGVPNGDQ